MLQWLTSDKHSYLLGQFLSYKEMKCCEYAPWSWIRTLDLGVGGQAHYHPGKEL
jgi:hypothetical protein